MIKRTNIGALLFILLVLFSCLGGKPEAGSEKSLPHIIIIYVDDMGIGDVSYSGGTFCETPHIDRLANNGKVFTQYYTPAPVCSPSRVCILTGQYHIRWGINTFLSRQEFNRQVAQQDYLYSKAPSMARMLRKVGYKTAHIGKWHMGGGRDVPEAPKIEEYGFDEAWSTWESPQPDPLLTSGNWIWKKEDSVKRWDRTAYFVDKTIDFIEKHPDKPCFVNLWPDDIHTPWVPDEKSQTDWRKKGRKAEKLLAVMKAFDEQIGRLVNTLSEMNQLNNTLIIFTSDNGPAPGFDRQRTNGLRGVKNSLYEGGIRMPMIVHWPARIARGQIDSTSVISSIDIYPTLASIVTDEQPESPDGIDLKNVFLDDVTLGQNRTLFFEYGRNKYFHFPKDSLHRSPQLAVRRGKWKLLTDSSGFDIELYNLEHDPTESFNLTKKYPEVTEKLKSEAIQWYDRTDRSQIY